MTPRTRKQSADLFKRGRAVMPDGVSSPMRAFALVGGNPVCVSSAKGSKVTDADGNVYTDYLNAFGALILGHAREEVVEAVARQASLGTVYGLSTELEYRLAERIVGSTPAIEKIRFACSGTEAVMTAVRIARAHTGRSLILKFGGSYHGHSDALLASPLNLDSAPAKTKGITRGIAEHLHREVLLCEYNDKNELEALFAAHGDRIAAALVEPYATNMGFVKPQPGFLALAKALCDQYGALLIFDEVVTGFRFDFGGACNGLGIDPDLVTFGKIIGGGAPIGAFAGKARYMEHVAVGNTVFHSGTFAANPLTMAAANAALDVLARPNFYGELESKGALLEAAVTRQFSSKGIPFHFSRRGALAGVAYRDGAEPMKSYKDVKAQKYDLFKTVHGRLLERGFLTAPSLEEPIFISAAHSRADLTSFAEALAESIELSLDEHSSRTRQTEPSTEPSM